MNAGTGGQAASGQTMEIDAAVSGKRMSTSNIRLRYITCTAETWTRANFLQQNARGRIWPRPGNVKPVRITWIKHRSPLQIEGTCRWTRTERRRGRSRSRSARPRGRQRERRRRGGKRRRLRVLAMRWRLDRRVKGGGEGEHGSTIRLLVLAVNVSIPSG
jgi:hypothetical protein